MSPIPMGPALAAPGASGCGGSGLWQPKWWGRNQSPGVCLQFPLSDSLDLFRNKALSFHRLPCFEYIGEILVLVGVILEHHRGAGSGSNEVQGAGANSTTRAAPPSPHWTQPTRNPHESSVRAMPFFALAHISVYFTWSILGSKLQASLDESICSKISSPCQTQGWVWAGRLHQKTGELWKSLDHKWTWPLIK